MFVTGDDLIFDLALLTSIGFILLSVVAFVSQRSGCGWALFLMSVAYWFSYEDSSRLLTCLLFFLGITGAIWTMMADAMDLLSHRVTLLFGSWKYFITSESTSTLPLEEEIREDKVPLLSSPGEQFIVIPD